MNLEDIRRRAESQPGGLVEMTKAEYGWLLDRIWQLERAAEIECETGVDG